MEDLEIVKIRLSKIDIIYYVPNGGCLVVSKYINFDSSLIIMPLTFKHSNSAKNCRYLTFVYFPLWVDYKWWIQPKGHVNSNKTMDELCKL